MKTRFITLMAALLLTQMVTFGQTYQQLWKQVEQAQAKDLPQSAMQSLAQIEDIATRNKDYGQLLKATLLRARLQATVAPDSLRPAVDRLERQEQQAEGTPLKAVYATVLACIYRDNHELDAAWQAKYDTYYARATAAPDQLAAVKAETYAPFVVNGKDSDLFNGDLLSVVGQELKAWSWLHRYYEQQGNRRAACLTALEMLRTGGLYEGGKLAESATVRSLDSLISVYRDLPEAGEMAIERYYAMRACGDVTEADMYDWLQSSLQQWGSWKRANQLRNELTQLTNPYYQVASDGGLLPEVGKSYRCAVTARNLRSMTLRVFRTRLEGDNQVNPNNTEQYNRLRPTLTELKDKARTLRWSGVPEYQMVKDSVELDGLPAGIYLIECTTQPQTSTWRFLHYVSSVRTMIEAQPDNTLRYVIVDAATGHPMPHAKLAVGSRSNGQQDKASKTLTADECGEVLYHYGDTYPQWAFAYTDDDRYSPSVPCYGRYYYNERAYNNEHTNVFTDRSLYRPGQTVHVAAIVWKEQSAIDNAAVADKKVKMELRDANFKLIGEQEVSTDRYGKCSADFTLPTGLLNGVFTIRVNGGSTMIRVEEYKRPTFQVEFPAYEQSYADGDTVRARAKAVTYAGVPVQGAKVKYTVRRQLAMWWMSYMVNGPAGNFASDLQSEVMKEGEATTGDDGSFEVLMPMHLPKAKAHRPMFYNFVVEAYVTDVAGETHSGTMMLPLGSKATALTCDVPQKIRKDQLPVVTIQRRNAAGQNVAGVVRYRLDGGEWHECAANAPSPLLENAGLASGEHTLQAVCEQDTVSTSFIVFGLDDKKPAIQTHDWFYASHSQFPNDGSPVTIQVGSSDANLYMVYSVFAGSKVIETGAVEKNGELVNRQFTYRDDYGNGLLISYAWVKDGVCYHHEQAIQRPVPNKQLTLKWETFRDRLTPGQQEEWRLRITRPDGTPADAQLMAVLYDKSLDQITPHQWPFVPFTYHAVPSTEWQWMFRSSLSGTGQRTFKSLAVADLAFSQFDKNVIPYYLKLNPVRARGGMLYAKSNAIGMKEEASAAQARMAVADMADDASFVVTEAVAGQETGDAGNETSDVQLRENLNETAFCFPALEADEDGSVVLKFTLPESLTTWRFMGVSHTADMYYGSIGAEAVAQKDVMVQPNVPRFVRMGDEAQIAARIFNTSDHAVSGTSILTLIDPETNKTVYQQRQSFSVEAEKTASVTFNVASSAFNTSLLICKVTAAGDGFSDGEQQYLPVLPDREMVTKTITFTQHEPGTQTIDLKGLFSAGATQQKLTVEYTNNPAWMMVQALPTIAQPAAQSAIEQATAYYANLLAKAIVDQNPQLKNVFEQWKREAGTDQSLQSQLQKNEELKDLVLAETPWVGAADREAEQKQRLADFFDENTLANRLGATVEKLKKLQNADGSFSWYPGMPGNTTVTIAVEEMLARLGVMATLSDDVKPIHAAAIDYIGKEMVTLVSEMKKQNQKDKTLPFAALRWLYICAISDHALPANVKSANDYLLSILKQDATQQSIYDKALTAVILAKHGEAKKAADYVQSLKEYTVYTEEMGRYYDTPRAAYSWYSYKIPTEVAAIEAIQTVSPQDTQTIAEMRRWLLQEKRTQAWDTPISSVNAVYAFLFNQPALTTVQEQTVLSVDGKRLELPTATAGLGYVKATVPNTKAKKLTAKKTTDGTAWGAVYAQFMQKTDEVEAAESGMKVMRELLASGPLKVGDRIKVRITVETTRDLDFVQLIDRRAACMEPVRQLSGYYDGAYCSPKDNAVNYYFYELSKGKHVIETEYYIDRAGRYETGICTVGCAYSPEFRATAPSQTLNVE